MCLAVSWRRSICYCHLKVSVFLFNPVNKLVTQQSRAPCSHLSAGLLPELVSGEGCEQGDKWAHQVWGSYLSDQVLYQLSIKGSLPSPSFWTVNLPLNNLSGKNSFLKQIFINFQNFQKKKNKPKRPWGTSSWICFSSWALTWQEGRWALGHQACSH